tara:strand:- start:49 stop:408 length:360 start_codon:yes stop_codon:yes gene_type:complete
MAFKMKGFTYPGESPVKYGGIIVKALTKGAKYLMKSKKAKNTGKVVVGGGAVDSYASDNTKNRSAGEKVLRTVDSYGPTMGVGSYVYDNRKEISKKADKVLKQRAENSKKGNFVGQSKI